MRPERITRRTFSIGALGSVAGLLAACGSSGSTGSSSSATGGGSSSSGGTWPVSVKHGFGTTTLTKEPTRVVTVGVTEQDFVLAVGVKPVGVTEWYGKYPSAMWPWATAANGTNKPKVLTVDDGLQYTQIAALRPDLIIAVNAGLDADSYAKLSKIAPTLGPASSKANWFASWTTMFTPIGQILGRSQQMEQQTKSIKDTFAAAAAANPQFKGKKAIFLQNAVYDGSLIAYPAGLGTEFLADLGFTVPTELNQYVKEGEQAYIPVEKISVLNTADVLIWATEEDSDKAALEKVPGFTNLAAVKAGRSVYTGSELSGAIYFTSPLSLPYVAQKLTPMLAGVLKA